MRSGTTFFLPVLVAALLSTSGTSQSRSDNGTNREKLIGAWHLLSLDAPGPDGKLTHLTDIKGQLIYTRDGHMSVQLMYPPTQSSLSNDYVFDGYEASFGTYGVDEKAHIITHHVQASVTRGLVGKDLSRSFQLLNGKLIIKSVRPDEHWAVTWQHD